MKIKGKYLAWSIIHLVIFIMLWSVELGIDKIESAEELCTFVLYMGLIVFVGWRFTENMEEAFK